MFNRSSHVRTCTLLFLDITLNYNLRRIKYKVTRWFILPWLETVDIVRITYLKAQYIRKYINK